MKYSTSVTPAGSEAPTTEIESWRLIRASATELQLAMLGGTGTSQRGRITINGQVYTFTSAVSGTNDSLSNNTTYYVYAYISSGAVALEFSTTTPNLQTPEAYAIKTGDGSRRYVGKTRTDGSAQFTVDSTRSAHRDLQPTRRLVNDLRLSLSSSDPVPTNDLTSQSTIYLLPYVGNRISLWNSTSGEWEDLIIDVATPPSLALSGLTSGANYDLFAYASGTKVALEALVWTNDTTRATALVRTTHGVLYKSGDATRRYLGTFRTTGTTTTEDSQAKRFFWNYYHRVTKDLLWTGNSDTYTSATVRDYANSSSNKFEFLIGIKQVMELYSHCLVRCSTAGNPVRFGFRIDTGTDYLNTYNEDDNWVGSGFRKPLAIAEGFHTCTARQASNGSATGNYSSPELNGVLQG